MTDEARCVVDGCNRPTKARNWCEKHYMRWIRHGDTSDRDYRIPTPKRMVERFWPKVDRKTTDECWDWLATLNNKGYGQLGIGGDRLFLAHRVAWELTNGPIPDGTCVCHRCDRPPCVNPAHLFLGSHADNMRDMGVKGRANGGKRKLTNERAEEIREHFGRGETRKALAKQYGVSRSAIDNVVNGSAWRDVP